MNRLMSASARECAGAAPGSQDLLARVYRLTLQNLSELLHSHGHLLLHGPGLDALLRIGRWCVPLDHHEHSGCTDTPRPLGRNEAEAAARIVVRCTSVFLALQFADLEQEVSSDLWATAALDAQAVVDEWATVASVAAGVGGTATWPSAQEGERAWSEPLSDATRELRLLWLLGRFSTVSFDRVARGCAERSLQLSPAQPDMVRLLAKVLAAASDRVALQGLASFSSSLSSARRNRYWRGRSGASSDGVPTLHITEVPRELGSRWTPSAEGTVFTVVTGGADALPSLGRVCDALTNLLRVPRRKVAGARVRLEAAAAASATSPWKARSPAAARADDVRVRQPELLAKLRNRLDNALLNSLVPLHDPLDPYAMLQHHSDVACGGDTAAVAAFSAAAPNDPLHRLALHQAITGLSSVAVPPTMLAVSLLRALVGLQDGAWISHAVTEDSNLGRAIASLYLVLPPAALPAHETPTVSLALTELSFPDINGDAMRHLMHASANHAVVVRAALLLARREAFVRRDAAAAAAFVRTALTVVGDMETAMQLQDEVRVSPVIVVPVSDRDLLGNHPAWGDPSPTQLRALLQLLQLPPPLASPTPSLVWRRFAATWSTLVDDETAAAVGTLARSQRASWLRLARLAVDASSSFDAAYCTLRLLATFLPPSRSMSLSLSPADTLDLQAAALPLVERVLDAGYPESSDHWFATKCWESADCQLVRRFLAKRVSTRDGLLSLLAETVKLLVR